MEEWLGCCWQEIESALPPDIAYETETTQAPGKAEPLGKLRLIRARERDGKWFFTLNYEKLKR